MRKTAGTSRKGEIKIIFAPSYFARKTCEQESERERGMCSVLRWSNPSLFPCLVAQHSI
jgi:hypothetical protein